jgi:predicted dehydrogenase
VRAVADVAEAVARRAAAEFGFASETSDSREIILDREIEVVDITAPNALHEEMALAAIGAGKHVYCEKLLATRSAGARSMAEAAETAGVRTQVGFNYLCNPIFRCACEMVKSGELGEIRGYRGLHCEDYMADAACRSRFGAILKVAGLSPI